MLVKEAISRLLVYLSPKTLKGKVVGTSLIAAFKDLAIAQKRQGISLTCHDYLITYYEMNGFIDEGESKSKPWR